MNKDDKPNSDGIRVDFFRTTASNGKYIYRTQRIKNGETQGKSLVFVNNKSLESDELPKVNFL